MAKCPSSPAITKSRLLTLLMLVALALPTAACPARNDFLPLGVGGRWLDSPHSGSQQPPRRACGKVVSPSQLLTLSKSDPRATGGASGVFAVGKARSPLTGASSTGLAQVVSFARLPAGSYGCQLSITFPCDMALFDDGVDIAGCGAGEASNCAVAWNQNWSWRDGGQGPVMNVYRVQGFAGRQDATYSSLVREPGIFGTVRVKPGEQVINTEVCGNLGSHGYLFEIADWARKDMGSGVSFTNNINAMDMYGSIGVFMVYNC